MGETSSESWFGAVIAVLEMTASWRPDLLEFQLETYLNSPMRFVVFELASILEIQHDQVGPALRRASVQVDRWVKRGGSGQPPVETIRQSRNLSAVLQVCRARIGRVSGIERRRLEKLLEELERARFTSGDRSWIETFIGRSKGGTEPVG